MQQIGRTVLCMTLTGPLLGAMCDALDSGTCDLGFPVQCDVAA